jgi:hypothetical protein
MANPVLYLGDDNLGGAAAYLAGLMTHWGWSFDHIPSEQPAPPRAADASRKLFILSDYPAARLEPALQKRLAARVAAGAGLVMLGGWGSYHGEGGRWGGTQVAAALPVNVATKDDRVNCDQPALVIKAAEHPITAGLPWDETPPTIGGFNAFTPKPGALVVLEVERYRARRKDGATVFEARDRQPLLVVGEHGKGRTAALGTDVAPHWVGGLVDWGPSRVKAKAAGGGGVEVGNQYAAFFRQLLAWAGRLE